MTGAVVDLIARGRMDGNLTDTGPNANTYWRVLWNKHTPFAHETVSQPFGTPTAWGQESQVTINRVGDLIYYLYLQIDLPGLVACDITSSECAGITPGGQFAVAMDNQTSCAPCSATDEAALVDMLPSDYDTMSGDEKSAALLAAKNLYMKEHYKAGAELACCGEGDVDCPSSFPELGNTWCYWVNDIGHFACKSVKLVIGGQPIDQLYGDFMYCWEELTGRSGRRLGEMTGRRYTAGQLVCDSRQARTLWVPIPFWFTLASGSALPLAALSYHGVQINVEWSPLEKMIVVSNSNVAVKKADTACCLTPNDLKAMLNVCYIYLDNSERDKFSSSHFEVLVTQTQAHYRTVTPSSHLTIPVSVNHPTTESIFAIRRDCHAKCNNWGNFSGAFGMDPVKTADLKLNTHSRFGRWPGAYWRLCVPYQFHSCVPDSYIYNMCWALNPENSTSPSGSCNLSRVDNVELELVLQDALSKEVVTVMIFSRCWNLMRFRQGVAGAAYQ